MQFPIRKNMKTLTTLLLLASVTLVIPSHASENLIGRVVGVSDGDTITLLDASKRQHKIRLAGIDAPESSQAFGNRSKQNLSNWVFGKSVNAECYQQDRYGRNVCKVMVSGIDANLEQVKAGMAWHFKQYEKTQAPSDRGLYAAAENTARGSKRGLFADVHAIPPWEFRAGNKPESTQASSVDCPCGSGSTCTGPKGGKYCIQPNGDKRYGR